MIDYRSTVYINAVEEAREKASSAQEFQPPEEFPGLLGMLFLAIIGSVWTLLNTALRPVAGTAFVAALGGAAKIMLSIFVAATETEILSGLAVAIVFFAWISVIFGSIFVFINARAWLLRIELVETTMLCHIFRVNQIAGAALHIFLYTFTAAASFYYAEKLIKNTTYFLMSSAAYEAEFGLPGSGVGMGPSWVTAICAFVAVAAVIHRNAFHPFARHFTLTGQLRAVRAR